MIVFINDKLKTIGGISSLRQLMADIGLADKKGLAVAVNDFVITKGEWKKLQLKENDKITVIRATQGG